MRALGLALGFGFCLVSNGCSGGDGGGAGQSGTSSGSGEEAGGASGASSGGDSSAGAMPTTASGRVSASAGGEVAAGDAILTVPADSLAGDVTVTVESKMPSATLPEGDTVQGLVYEFGPEGTTFDPPATLKLPVEATPAANEDVVISWLDTSANAWVDLDATVARGEASAQVEHFTAFAVRFITGDGSMQGGTLTFPCPVGVWSVSVSGQATCDGGTGSVTLTIESVDGGLMATQTVENIQGGAGCSYEVTGSASYEGDTLSLDFTVDDNGCEKHWLSAFTVDADCKTISTDGDFTVRNCESCDGGGCGGCGSMSCTTNYGPGTFTRN